MSVLDTQVLSIDLWTLDENIVPSMIANAQMNPPTALVTRPFNIDRRC